MAITREQALNDGILGGCPLLDGREKLDFDDIIGEVVTIEDFASIEKDGSTVYAITLVEYPQSYAWAGGCLKKFIEKYDKDFIGTQLVVGEKVKTRSNNDYRTFEVYDGKASKGKTKK